MLLVWLFSLVSMAAAGQALTAGELVDLLTHRAEREDRRSVEMGVFSCGQVVADRELARELRRRGAGALAAIEGELEHPGPGWHWLALTYAAIRGREAAPVLRRLVANGEADAALALALGWTSYVSATRPAVAKVRCLGGAEPRDTLDRVVLGVLQGNRMWLETAFAAGEPVPGELARTGAAAVGYRFRGEDAWARPVGLGEDEEAGPPPYRDAGRFRMETDFRDERGRPCGSVSIPFRRGGEGFLRFVVEREAAGELVRTIARCAAR